MIHHQATRSMNGMKAQFFRARALDKNLFEENRIEKKLVEFF